MKVSSHRQAENIVARDYLTGEPRCLAWSEGRITRYAATASQRAPANVFLAPALFDPQINGYGGVDFQQDNLTADELLTAARCLRRDGCAGFLLTLITDDWEMLTKRLTHLKKLRDQCPELRRAIVGWHIEGPFISPEPGYRGAHEPTVMLDPTPKRIRQLRKLTGTDPVLLTMAPERKAAIKAIKLAVQLGFKVSLGHCNPSPEAIRQAVDAGATGFTHLGNGCPQELDRHDNILWRVLDTPELTPSLIPDGMHVRPAPFRLYHRGLAGRNFFYTTDAMSAGGAPPGTYRLGKTELAVGEDQIVRKPGQTNFAGSALRPLEGVKRSAAMLGVPWTITWQRMSEAPARFMGLPAGLVRGREATFCLVETNQKKEIKSVRTFVGGVSKD